MPDLSSAEYELIEEWLLDDKPTTWIARELCVSVWSVRKISQRLKLRREQHDLFPDIPF